MGNYPWRQMNHKLVNNVKMWKGNVNTTTLLFFLKGHGILPQERRGQVNTIVMEHFNSILSHKSRPANKQYTNHSLFPILNPLMTLLNWSCFFNCRIPILLICIKSLMTLLNSSYFNYCFMHTAFLLIHKGFLESQTLQNFVFFTILLPFGGLLTIC